VQRGVFAGSGDVSILSMTLAGEDEGNGGVVMYSDPIS
jgi:hypothetical protein